MIKSIPLFTSTYSIGCSILTLDKPKDVLENGPKSIISTCLENKLSELYLVEDNMSGFAAAFDVCRDNKIDLRFGLKIVICNNIEDKTPESITSEHKVIIFARNDSGFKRLLKLYSFAATTGFFNIPRIDCITLSEFWDEKDLLLVHPFYSSFLHRNSLYFSNCQDCVFGEKVFLVENNNLPFNYLIENAIDNYGKSNPIKKINTQSIYYINKGDFPAYLTNRCLNKRSFLDAPEINHMASDEFCFEHWRKLQC
jgi:DNA polymerase III alpha subunit